MKNLYGILVCYLVLFFPVVAHEVPFNKTLGPLHQSSIVLDFDNTTIPTYSALDSLYVPVTSLTDVGCSVTYTEETGTIDILPNSNFHAFPSNIALDFENKPFSLYFKPVWLGNFRTHAIVAQDRVLIPVGALRQLWDIDTSSTYYKLSPKEQLPLLASQDRIENQTNVATSVSVVDLYWDNKLVTKTNSYTLVPYETTTRSAISIDENSPLYLSTIITKAESETLNYSNNNMYGQVNIPLFSKYTALKNNKVMNGLGDPIDSFTVNWAENTVNQMQLHSKTSYLVWTNIEKQKTYIFQGSSNNWKLIKHFICSTGRAPTPTPKGQFALTWKVPYFGVEKGYRCKNAFGFIGSSYLYHSLIFDKSGRYLLEGKGVLGTPASQGCIRFSVENSEWFYNHMVSGTKVWIN